MVNDYVDCENCSGTVLEENSFNGHCEACASLLGEIDVEPTETVELPKSVVRKLAEMSQTRHPTACNQVAPQFVQTLDENGHLDE